MLLTVIGLKFTVNTTDYSWLILLVNMQGNTI